MTIQEFDPDVWLCAYCGEEIHLSDIEVRTSETGQFYASKCCMGYIGDVNNDVIPADKIAEELGRRGEGW